MTAVLARGSIEHMNVNTWLIYLRFQQLRGQLSPERHVAELEIVKALLRSGREPHYTQFLAAWEAPA